MNYSEINHSDVDDLELLEALDQPKPHSEELHVEAVNRGFIRPADMEDD